MKEFGKVYHTVEEYEHHFGVFKDNLLKALKHQALDPTASHGVTQFSDLTKEEFGHRYLGLKAPAHRRLAAQFLLERVGAGFELIRLNREGPRL
jgi:cathepsin F